MKNHLAALCAAIAACGLFVGGAAQSQELEPRAFSPGPTGFNIAAVSGAYSSGDLVFDAALPIKDATGNSKSVGVGYQRFFGLFGKTAKFAVAGAWADGHAEGLVGGQNRVRDMQGFTDPRLGVSWIFFGAPAMAPAQYSKYRPTTVSGVSFGVSPPVGQYDRTRVINIGTNRWTFRSQFGVAHYWQRWMAEGTLGGQFFTGNDEYYPGSAKQSQNPVGSVQGHVSYAFKPQMWIAASATYYRGGATSVDGVPTPGFQSNSRYGVSGSMPLTRGQALGLNYSRGLSTRSGSNYDTVIVTWLVKWFDRK